MTVAISYSSNYELIKRFKDHAKKQRERPDPLLVFVLKQINRHTTVLDIGAGSGRWTVPLAKIARIVTAVEPSGAMRDMLIENIASAKLKNVQIVRTSWEEATVESHDVTVCVHSIYFNPDFSSFIRKSERIAGV